ncbi:MAG: Oxidoreductase, short chain dehydrogenase/reductase family protein [Firmicutes bacterium]|nr:Oxidoreductase, short chain dehydrogenase/reductase family protein [Bacillota bacterium]
MIYVAGWQELVSRAKGIGTAVCRNFAVKGADIFFTYWRPYDRMMTWGVEDNEPLQLQKELTNLGVRCESLELDLSEEYSYLKLMDMVENKLGVPDILVNNACYSVNDNFESISTSSLDEHYKVNIRATTLLSTEFVKRFTKGFGGRIINLTSGQSLGPMPDELSYAITKGAIETITYTLSAAVVEKGITVNAVNPGPTDTGWMTKDLESELIRRFPLNRIGQPEDVARLIAFLASDDAQWITGQVIHSEGGFKR